MTPISVINIVERKKETPTNVFDTVAFDENNFWP